VAHGRRSRDSVRTLWRAFDERDLDAVEMVTAPGFVNHNALPGCHLYRFDDSGRTSSTTRSATTPA
jgi:hypothetical protein